MNHTPIISTQALTRTFGSFTAVDRLEFDVYPGEIFGFLGANGAGKTTAMRMLCGLLAPSSGSAQVAGFDIALHPEEVKRIIGYMSQRFSLYDDLTVSENIQFYSGIYGLSKTQIKIKTDELLTQLHLAEHSKQLVRSLPLGWKQKLAFSVALVHEPPLVFLDEPTGGVDPITRREFWEMIYAAAARGVTVFVTTHYMDEASYCHRVSIMVDGRLDALGSPASLKHQFGVDSMDAVFLHLARKAQRSE